MNRARVLIVNDNISDTNEIEDLLSESDIEFVRAGSADEVIELAYQLDLALVLIEVTPDDSKGYEIAKIIRNNPKLDHLNILYITNTCCEAYLGNDSMFAGAVDFIARPVNPGILKGKVQSLINQFLQRKQLEEELEQRKIMEEKLIVAKRQEEEAVDAKKTFLSTMSHEIRTPLNSIINTINLLISEEPRRDQLEDMDVLKFSAENLLNLINEILDYSKIDSGKIVFEEIEFNIRKLFAGIRQSMQYGMVKNGNSLDLSVEENVPAFLIGDSGRLAQIFFNLVGNALKFTEKGKVSFTTEVSRDLGDSVELIFKISDTGIGIPEDKQKDIFEAFTQASASVTREYGGTGLGLAITKMLVELMGGKIEVTSKPHQGSTFTVTLSFRKSEKNQSEEYHKKFNQTFSLDGMNVLVVEDNLINQNIVLRLLTKWNANPDSANNGRIAVEKVRNKHYHLVLMDLHMPEMSGYEATQKIRQMDGDYYRTLPILAVTASAFAEDRKKICDSGMNGYIIKPFNPAELNSKISRFLDQKMTVQ